MSHNYICNQSNNIIFCSFCGITNTDKAERSIKCVVKSLELDEAENSKIKFKTLELESMKEIKNSELAAAKYIEDGKVIAMKALKESELAAAKDIEDGKVIAMKALKESELAAAKDIEDGKIIVMKALKESELAAAKQMGDEKLAAIFKIFFIGLIAVIVTVFGVIYLLAILTVEGKDKLELLLINVDKLLKWCLAPIAASGFIGVVKEICRSIKSSSICKMIFDKMKIVMNKIKI